MRRKSGRCRSSSGVRRCRLSQSSLKAECRRWMDNRLHTSSDALNKNLELLEKYFTTYPLAIESLTRQYSQRSAERLTEFCEKLESCPPGKKHFSEYEKIGTEIWQYLFAEHLG